MTYRGGYCFVHAVANGAPIVISAIERVPIRSICAGVAPVNGVFGSFDMESYSSWNTPNAKFIPHPVKTRVVEAMMIMVDCLQLR